jgi:hypothetical protein
MTPGEMFMNATTFAQHCIAFAAICHGMCFHAAVAEPPLPGSGGNQPYPEMDFPYNIDLYERTGTIPDELELHDARSARPLLMNTPYGTDWPSGHVEDGGTIQVSNRGGGTTNARETRQFQFRVAQNELFPLFDDMYVVEDVRCNFVRLKRVTRLLPEALRPSSQTRVIPGNSYQMPLFLNPAVHESYRREGWVTVKKIAPADDNGSRAHAVIEICPPYSKSFVESPNEERKTTEVTLKQGDLLKTEYQAYKILRIMPPKKLTLKNHGKANFVGWIEIDPKPVN